MTTTVQLDYQAILANSAQPVYLAFQFADGLNLLASALLRLGDTENYTRSRKALRAEGAGFCKMSSSEHWEVNEAMPTPSFKKPRPKTPPMPDATDPATSQPHPN